MNKCGCQGRCSCGSSYCGKPYLWEKNDPCDKAVKKPTPIPLKPLDDSWKLDYERELKDPIKIVFPRSAAEEAAEKAAKETASVGPISILTLKGVIAVDVKVESLNDLVIDSKIFKIKRAIQEKLCEIKEVDITTKISIDVVDLKQTIS
jgi:hypothetical protein